MGYTKGPWEVKRTMWGHFEVRAGDKTLAFMEDYKNAEEDAKIMAAAPRLLKAAKEILDSHEVNDGWLPWDEIRDAIAWAEG